MTEFDEQVPDESEQLDQLDTDDTLDDSPLADPLDQGYAPPDRWSAGEGFGNTAAEMAQGESLEQRLAQEVPEAGDDPDDERDDGYAVDADGERIDEGELDPEVGDARAGRLVDVDGGYGGLDVDEELLGDDVGVDGAGASAEEAAVHVIEEEPR